MIRNRAFQGSPSNTYDPTTDYWEPVGDVTLTIGDDAPVLSAALPDYMNLEFGVAEQQTVGISNEGYYGMRVDVSKRYVASFHVRGKYEGGVTGSFVNTITGHTLGITKTRVESGDDAWTQVDFPVFNPDVSPGNPNNTFHFTFDDSLQLQGRSLQVNLLSVFEQTYKDRVNGLRIDMAETFVDLGTTLTRLPGGNSMQGPAMNEELKWNETIGPLTNRPGMLGVWGYPPTNGLGILEQAQWMRDTNQEIFLGVFAGLHIGGDLVPESQLQPYVGSALDEIEFLTVGSVLNVMSRQPMQGLTCLLGRRFHSTGCSARGTGIPGALSHPSR